MKVTRATVFRADFAAFREGAKQAVLVVQLETDEGVSGAGEIGLAYGQGGRGAAHVLLELAQSHVIGRDPFRTEAIFDSMTRTTFWGHARGAIFGAAVSAIDQALHDIKGKALGVPVHELLGGACREELRLYCNGWYRGAASAEAYAEAARSVVSRGYDAMKFDPMKLDASGHAAHPNRNLDRDLEKLAVARVEAVREAVGDAADLCIELHGNIWPMDSIRFGQRIKHIRPFFMEEVADAEDATAAAEVGRATGISIAGGERLVTAGDFRRFFEAKALHLAQPDMGIAGGFTGVKAIAHLAAAHGVFVQPHNCGGPISTAACVQLSLSIPNFLIQELFPVWPEDDRLDLVEAPLEKTVVKGRMPRPTGPGLGVTLNADYLKRCEKIGS
jgi:galactonate dehydratase